MYCEEKRARRTNEEEGKEEDECEEVKVKRWI